jgi:hypothetical protein
MVFGCIAEPGGTGPLKKSLSTPAASQKAKSTASPTEPAIKTVEAGNIAVSTVFAKRSILS